MSASRRCAQRAEHVWFPLALSRGIKLPPTPARPRSPLGARRHPALEHAVARGGGPGRGGPDPGVPGGRGVGRDPGERSALGKRGGCRQGQDEGEPQRKPMASTGLGGPPVVDRTERDPGRRPSRGGGPQRTQRPAANRTRRVKPVAMKVASLDRALPPWCAVRSREHPLVVKVHAFADSSIHNVGATRYPPGVKH